MDLQWLMAVAGFCFVTCFTPGPNNTMLMASGLNFGISRTMPHMLGVSFGFPLMVFCVGLGVAQVFQAFPALYTALKIISIGYLLWLALQIAMADSVKTDNGQAQPLTFVQAAAFQWVNPKAWVMAVGISATYLIAGQFWASLVVFSGIFLIAGLCSSSSWMLGGAGLRALIGNRTWVRVINIGLAVVLVASLWPIVMELAVAHVRG
ncbi:MAG: threonine/homoserine/homoserine lactone efflux protein [Alphaproteobacteria bacterium]|jgi:threonine/homoserine/homoserine lactone efflux protein